jgi:hypothetical protein
MTGRPPVRTLRGTMAYRAAILGAALLFAAVMYGISNEKPLVFGMAVVCAALAAAGVAESWLAYIELLPDSVVVRTLLGRRRYERGIVQDVTWEKGSGVALRLAAGGWAKLPYLGHSNQSVAGAVRAWLDEGSRLK